MIKIKDLSWVSIDPDPEFGSLPPPQYRRWIRVGVLTKPLSNIIRAGEREFWCFIDRKTSTFYIEEVDHSKGCLKMVKEQEEFDELWDYAKDMGLLSIIIPWEDPPAVHSDRASAMKLAHEKYRKDMGWSGQE